MIVTLIDKKLSYPWLEEKHYAHKIPAVIQLAFGCFFDGELVGVCTFSPPPRMYNFGKNLFSTPITIPVFELSRLVIQEKLPKNTLSQFVGGIFKIFPQKPSVLVSYADSNVGHHGYIYQATNWLFTGKTNKRKIFFDSEGKQIHERVLFHRYNSASTITCEKNHVKVLTQEGKYRYFYFLGSSRIRRNLLNNFNLSILSYPKGENQRY